MVENVSDKPAFDLAWKTPALADIDSHGAKD